MAVVFFGRRSVANTNANGERQTPSWTPPQRVSTRALSKQRPANPERNSLLNLDFLGSRDTCHRNITKNNHQKITIASVKTNHLELADSEGKT
jgi:hypothetical protein